MLDIERITASFLIQQAVSICIDVHTLQACNIFNCTPDQVTPEMRHCGKLENYFRIYGGKH